MDTKDQAVAPDCWVVIKDGQIIGMHDAPCHLAGIEAVRYVQAQPPAPDCRTCRQFYWSQFAEDYRCHFTQEGGTCTKGDKHFAVPAMVLWRTK